MFCANVTLGLLKNSQWQCVFRADRAQVLANREQRETLWLFVHKGLGAKVSGHWWLCKCHVKSLNIWIMNTVLIVRQPSPSSRFLKTHLHHWCVLSEKMEKSHQTRKSLVDPQMMTKQFVWSLLDRGILLSAWMCKLLTDFQCNSCKMNITARTFAVHVR